MDSIDHGTYLDDESIELFKRTGAYLVPTLMPGVKLPESMEGNPFFTDDIKEKAYAAGAAAAGNIGRAYQAGVNIAFGTDSAVTPHGLNGEEFALMVQVGGFQRWMRFMRPPSEPRRCSLRPKQIGSIEVGKLADIIATDASPLSDISELEKRLYGYQGLVS